MAAKNPATADSAVPAFEPTGVFNSIEVASIGAAPIANWDNVQGRLQQERKLAARCLTQPEACSKHLLDWQSKIAGWRDLAVAEQVAEVNRFANRAIRYTDDRKTFKKSDYWATPIQSLRGRGDCEDYALLKYESLLALGFPKQDLRIVVVMDQRKNIAHAVLSVKTDAGTFILDNQNQRVLRDDAIRHYAPLYSINEKGRWLNIATRAIKPRRLEQTIVVARAKTPDAVPALDNVKTATAVTKPAFKPSIVAAIPPEVKAPTPRLQAIAAAALLRPSVSMVERALPTPAVAPTQPYRWASLLAPLVNFLTRALA